MWLTHLPTFVRDCMWWITILTKYMGGCSGVEVWLIWPQLAQVQKQNLQGQGGGLNFNLKSSCQRLTSHLAPGSFACGLLASTPAIISVTDLSRSFHPAQGAKVSVVVVDFESHRMATRIVELGSGYQASTRSFGSRLILPLKFTETIGQSRTATEHQDAPHDPASELLAGCPSFSAWPVPRSAWPLEIDVLKRTRKWKYQ